MDEHSEMIPALKDMRRLVEQRYREALSAIDLLERYAATSPIPQLSGSETGVSLDKQVARPGSKKSTVLSAIKDQCLTAAEIEKATHLPRKEIRGVLYAKDVRPRLETSVRNGAIGFRLRASALAKGGEDK